MDIASGPLPAATESVPQVPLLNRRAKLAAVAVNVAQKQPADLAPQSTQPGPSETPRIRSGKASRQAARSLAAAAANSARPGADGGSVAEVVSPDLVGHEELSETTALLYDPQNSEAVRQAIARLDEDILALPDTQVVPNWVHRWAQLSLYSERSFEELLCGWRQQSTASGGVDGAFERVVMRLRRDLIESERLRSEIEFGLEGGIFGLSSKQLELPPQEVIPHHAATGSAPPFWTVAGAAATRVDDLISNLKACLEKAEQLAASPARHPTAADGSQEQLQSHAAVDAQTAVIEQVALETVLTAQKKTGSQQQQQQRLPQMKQRVADAVVAIHDVPVIHDKFVIENSEVVMDPLAVKEPDMLASPESLTDRDAVRRSYTIHIPFLRFRERQDFTAEQRLASQLLDAYEQYQLLVGNLRTDIKSRNFYRQLISTIESQQRIQELQQQQPVVMSASVSAATAATQQYVQQHQTQLVTLRDLHQRSSDAERACLLQMITCWRQLTQIRAAQGYSGVTLTLALRRHTELTNETPNAPAGAADDVLQYVPVVSDTELAAGLPTPVEASQPPPAAVAQRQPLPPSQLNVNLKLVVYARTSKTIPPRYVGSTELRTMNSTCTVYFNETFQLRTTHDPTELVLHVVNAENVAVAAARIPASTATSAMLLPFQTGSYFISGPTNETKEVCGVISVATTWTTSEGLSMEAIERMFLRGEADPLDPSNERYIQLLRKHYLETGDGSDDGDRQHRYQEGAGGLFLPLAPALGARHEMLQRRWLISNRESCAVDEAEAKLADRAIPLDDNLAKRLLRDLKKESATAAIAATAAASAASAALAKDEAHRRWQQKVKNIKLMHQSKRRIPDHEKLAKYLVLPPLPTFSGVLQYIVDTLSPQSNLNPRRDQRKDVSEIDRKQLKEHRESCHILVHVMKASNLPLRDDGSELEPVIEARFVTFSASGRTEAGPHPSWFESLKVRFEPPDFDEDTLSLIDDDIVIAVYDKMRVDLPPATVTIGASADVVHYRVERRLLGTVRIPFYTLYTTEKASVEGMFTIDVPRWIMGYRCPPMECPPMIQLYIALNPPLRRKKDRDSFGPQDLAMLPVSLDLHRVHMLALTWRENMEYCMQQVVAENPIASWRSVDPFVPNSVGDATLICRYMLPMGGAPPPTVTTIPAAVRYCSLQKFEVDMVTWGDRDVWSTNAEFLATGRGDYEEMALLLVHMLRYLARQEQTFLVLGKGAFYHQAAFVLHSMQGTWKLIDPRTGDIHDVHNAQCELTEVSMVVTHNQAWANVQLSGTPYRMMWDLNDGRYWMPLFSSPLPDAMLTALLDPIQREHLTYPPVTDGQAFMIEDGLKKAVKKALKFWRNDRQPTYQERVGTILKEVLEELERERRECANYKQRFVDDAHHKALQEFQGEYVTIGNPVHGRYDPTDEYAAILTDVQETMIHCVGTDAVRFGLATFAYPYSGDTVAIWVYLVALVPRSRDR